MNVLDPLAASRRIAAAYRRYLISTYGPRRAELREEFERALGSGFRLTRGPYLQASPPFVHGHSVTELIDASVLAPGFTALSEQTFPISRTLYAHQEEAIRKAVEGRRNLVVATGTGSGKTECFLLPIIDRLLREHETGTLPAPGVRALLLYPMNALANDQVKRLRRLLRDLPQITFGRYVGETAHEQARAEDDFRNRYPSEPRLPNELISREAIQAAPPHILLTNYAMLEYLLLRPADSTLFDGPTGQHWRFLVLDEAHVYGGAQGSEVAMLLRRLRDRVLESRRGQLQCFATSATLGRGVEDYPALVTFATRLFDETFEWDPADPARQDVVAARRRPLVQAKASWSIPESVLTSLQRAFRAGASAEELATTVKAAGVSGAPTPEPGQEPAAWLAALLADEEHVVAVQERLERGAAEFGAVASDVIHGPAGDEDLVALVDLCVAARPRPDDAPLLPARYHFFLRSLEGAFVCLHPDHRSGEARLVLARHLHCPSCQRTGRQTAMFELGVCRHCRAEYLVGQLQPDDTGRQRLKVAPDFGAVVYVLLGDPIDADDEDEAATAAGDPARPEARQLCTGCATISEEGGTCACPSPPRPRATWLLRPRGGTLHTCGACSARASGEVVTRFLTGTDAPVSVVTTQLYQALPPSGEEGVAQRVGEGRRLLTFSDSRQDAAFFAPYLERTYGRSVQRRIIAEAISRLAIRDVPRTDDVIVEARRLAEDTLVLDPDQGSASARREVGSWLAEELLALDRRQSLEGTGSAEITVAIPRAFRPPPPLLALGLTETEVRDLLLLLLETLRAGGAITVPDGVDVRDERFAPRNREFGAREAGPEAGVVSWLPGSGANRRTELLTKIITRRDVTINAMEILTGLWKHFTDPNGPWRDVLVGYQDKQRGALWRLNWERFEFLPLADDHRPLRCDVCQRLWWRTVAGICPGWRCPGTVTPVEDIAGLIANHYAALYRELDPIGIAVQEHTAQWTGAKASAVQDDFVAGRVNVLSCSTTFELGVDVGEVQAVLLRNVPPSPANYVQRAGRAGRRTDSAALVVTFAQRRSHDLAWFDRPDAMVDGVVTPPVVFLDNATIVRRHVHSVAYAAFERRAADDGGAHRHVRDFFDRPAEDVPAADDQFVTWLRTRPAVVGAALQRVVPAAVAAVLGIDDWRWVDALVEPTDDDPTFGWLTRAGSDARDELAVVREARAEAAAEEKYDRAKQLQYLERTIGGRDLLGYLSSKNVLPKYGFPVDVVELNLGRSGDARAAGIELSRDLSLAISEYAPGAQVVAAKTLWKSDGLATRSGHAWPTYKWAQCGDCGAFRRHLVELPPCEACGSTHLAQGKTGSYVIPIFGFVGSAGDRPGEARPPRMSISETYFGSYRDEPPHLAPAPGFSRPGAVQWRTSRQGRITVVNRGPVGRGFRLCPWCGYGEPAPVGGREGRGPREHRDLRRPGRPCAGNLIHRHLGHEFLTDVTEIRLDVAPDEAIARSTLYALLEGTGVLEIDRDDVDGTLYWLGRNIPPALVVFAAVPGGAGHSQRIGDHLERVFRAGLARVSTCECGPETSCYNCLRNYRNQPWHDSLARGAAQSVLENVLQGKASGDPGVGAGWRDLDLLDAASRPLVRAAIEAGAPNPEVGWEPDTTDGWVIEAAWPGQHVAIVHDDDPALAAWLARHGWTARLPEDWTVDDLIAALGVTR